MFSGERECDDGKFVFLFPYFDAVQCNLVPVWFAIIFQVKQ